MEVHLSEIAFTGMLLAALEAFRKESYGLLLGQQTKDCLVIQYAIPYQTARRHNSWVQRNEAAHGRMEKFLANLHHLNLIGDFHSHTSRAGHVALCRLSALDKQSLHNQGVCLVLAMNPRVKYQPWRYNCDGSISGTVEDFFVKIGAWHGGANGQASRAQLVCPFAIGFDWN